MKYRKVHSIKTPMEKTTPSPAEFTVPLYINQLQGRMLCLPAPKKRKREILLIQDRHTAIERWWGLALELNRYGAVTMPDLPGFGAMHSFYRVGVVPTLDNLADYLAAFLKLRYKRKKITIVSIGFGFAVVTRMLQRCPDLQRKVNIVVSLGGYAHHSDLRPGHRKLTHRLAARIFSRRIPAIFYRNIFLHPALLKAYLRRTSEMVTSASVDFDIYLWRANDLRTHMETALQVYKLDNCQKHVDVPLYQVTLKDSAYFDTFKLEQHLRVAYTKVKTYEVAADIGTAKALPDAKAARKFIPPQLRKVLGQQ